MNSCAINLLVIGYGNILRGDDGVGVVAAQCVADLMPSVQVEAVHQLTPELMETISQAGRVIFIDAALDGVSGGVVCQSIHPSGEFMTHTASPAGLLAGVEMLYGTSPPAFLLTVTGEQFELGETLSASVQAALPIVLNWVQKLMI